MENKYIKLHKFSKDVIYQKFVYSQNGIFNIIHILSTKENLSAGGLFKSTKPLITWTISFNDYMFLSYHVHVSEWIHTL